MGSLLGALMKSPNIVSQSTKLVDIIRFAWNNAKAINLRVIEYKEEQGRFIYFCKKMFNYFIK